MSERLLLTPFGPKIAKVKMPEDLVKKLNDYIDKVINDKILSNDLNHGEELVGDVTQEIKLEPKIVKDSGWADFLALNVSKWIFSEIGKK